MSIGAVPSVAKGAAFNRGRSKQDFETPPEFIRAVEKRFGPITFDLAASRSNAKAPGYFTEAQDSLKQDWHKLPGLLWINPPFANIAPWAEKCRIEADRGAQLAFLVPAAVGSNWYRDHVYNHARVYFLNGRIAFVGQEHGYPKDLILCRYGMAPGHFVWRWM